MKKFKFVFLFCCCFVSSPLLHVSRIEGYVVSRSFCRKSGEVVPRRTISCAVRCSSSGPDCFGFDSVVDSNDQSISQCTILKSITLYQRGFYLTSPSSERYLDCNWKEPTAPPTTTSSVPTTTKNLNPVPLEIAVETGTMGGAATDAQVNLTLYFTLFPQHPPIQEVFPLINDSYNLFESGQVDRFFFNTQQLTLGDPCDLIAINLKHDNTGVNPPWRPMKLSITNRASGVVWTVPIKSFISEAVNNCSLTLKV